jgi:hypothetical protein
MRGGWLLGVSLGIGVLVGAQGARAATLTFDDLASLSDVAAASYPGVNISTALVVSEADAATLTGFDTSHWATSDPNGIFNTLASSVTFDFSSPVSAFSIDVVGLPSVGGYQQVLLSAYRGNTLVDVDLSDPGALGDSGFAEALLSVAALNIDRIVLAAVVPSIMNGVPCFALGDPGTFFADNATFTPVPEPAGAALLLLGLAGVAARGLRKGNA